jgi:excisionase family DNA binding protein
MQLQIDPGFTLPEAAKILGIHDKSIYRLVNQQKMQAFLGLDNRLRISKEELHYYLRRQEEQTMRWTKRT